jgi:hypothetical protein
MQLLFDVYRAKHRDMFLYKTNQMHQFFKFILFCSSTLHVSDGLSVHHQESKTAHTASGICQTDSADCLLAGTRWNSSRPARPRTQHDYHHDTKVKPEAATAVIEFLIMGGKTPETCWAVNKCQDNKLKICCIRLEIYLNCTMMYGLTNLKFYIYILAHPVCKMWIIQEAKKKREHYEINRKKKTSKRHFYRTIIFNL